jgi:DNA-directed RNA polymerase subunit RPC12/RpoP/tetratricopeptide (TPR) repeat protein
MLRSVAVGLMISFCVGGTEATQQTNSTAIVADSKVAEQLDLRVKAAVALAYRADAIKKALLSGNENEIQRVVSHVDLLRREYGTNDVTSLVDAMCQWAVELGEDGNTEMGNRVLKQISRLAPEYPALLAAEVELLRLEGTAGYFKGLPQAIKLSLIRMENPATRYHFIIQHVSWIKFMGAIMLWGVAVVLALKYRRFLRNLFEAPLVKFIDNRHFVAAATGVILALPIILGLDPSFNAFLWLLLLIPILTSSELKIAILCILIQLIYPCTFLIEQKFVNNNLPLSIETIQTQPQPTPINKMLLDKLSSEDQQFLTGWNALHSNNWVRAESIFRDLSAKQHYEKSVVLNNLGVALQNQGHTKEALDSFIEASKTDPMAFEPIYNQAIIYFAGLEYEIAEQKHAEARKKRTAGYDHMFSSMSSIMQQIVIAMPIRDTPERANALTKYYMEHHTNHDIEMKESIGTSTIIWIIWPILGIIAVAIWRSSLTSFTKSYQCKRCGEVFQIDYNADSNICSHCYHLFVLKDDAHAESRIKKIKEISKYKYQNKWIYTIL